MYRVKRDFVVINSFRIPKTKINYYKSIKRSGGEPFSRVKSKRIKCNDVDWKWSQTNRRRRVHLPENSYFEQPQARQYLNFLFPRVTPLAPGNKIPFFQYFLQNLFLILIRYLRYWRIRSNVGCYWPKVQHCPLNILVEGFTGKRLALPWFQYGLESKAFKKIKNAPVIVKQIHSLGIEHHMHNNVI